MFFLSHFHPPRPDLYPFCTVIHFCIMTVMQAPTGIGALWYQRMNSLKDYEVIRDGNVFGSGFANNFVFSSEYDNARRYLDHLISKYEGIPFSHVFPGTEITNEGGTCFRLQNSADLPPLRFDSDLFREEILHDLTLVRGIGEKTHRHLNNRGYRTIEDLCNHPKFKSAASFVKEQLTAQDNVAIMDFIGSRHRRSHPLVLGTAGFHEPEELVFIDIETLGLFSRPITLFGVGTIEQGRLNVFQYLLRDIEEEQAALIATMEHLAMDRSALVTFNGKSFDLPYILDRLAYYGMTTRPRIAHYDMLHFSRQKWKGRFPSFRLAVLEKELLGVSRQDDIPGQMVPEFYEIYLRTENCGPLVPIVEHNLQDVISLAKLFLLMLGDSFGC